MCTTVNRTRGRRFSAGSCPVLEGNTVCGETKTLDIINEFKRLYEEKMEEIENTNCGDCLQEKIKLQQDWIGDLTEQNEMLVRAVEELEIEATERVKMLEDKLKRSAESISEVMKKYRENDVTNGLLEEPRQRIFNLENDMKNILEFLRRARDEHQWTMAGLTFYEITEKDIFGTKCEADILREINNGYLNQDTCEERNRLRDQGSHLRSLETRALKVDGLAKELEAKREECESLQKNMIDMRQALTEEVATKHDAVLKMRRECQELEERCIQADKQTAFRDDIIKELRKELKQLKQQENRYLREDGRKMVEKILSLASKLEIVKYKIGASLEQIEAKITNEEKSQNENVSRTSTMNTFIRNLNNLAGPVKDNLYSFMEKEIIDLNKVVEVKHKQLQELFEVNKILIHRLFSADNGLQFLEERALSALVHCLENESGMLKSKNSELETSIRNYKAEKTDLMDKVNTAKSTIQSLEIQFNEFLQERDQLKVKYKSAAKQGASLLEECTKMKTENSLLKTEYDKVRKEFDRCSEDKNILRDKLNEFKERLNELVGNKDECICRNNLLFEENKKLSKELDRLNEMNEHLLSTINGLRGQLNVTSRITTDEVTKLNKTIDILQTTLEQGKVLHEEEEKGAVAEINCLTNRIKEYENCISKQNREIQGRNEKIISLTNQIKEAESCFCHWKKIIKEKEHEISKLHKTIKEFESIACGCENQLQEKEHEISKLHKTIKEFESITCGCENQLQNKNAEISTLNNTIREMESCICGLQNELKGCENVHKLQERIAELEFYISDLQSKAKLCKICKQNIRVNFSDCTEVQTDAHEPTEQQLELLLNRDELIKYQTSTLEKMQQELQSLCQKEKELLAQKETSCKEMTMLQNKVLMLEGKLNEARKNEELMLSNKEEIIKKQKEALNLLQKEAECLRAKEAEMRSENEHYCSCVEQLKNKINDLEAKVQIAEMRSNNLQMAVDLYTNTINVLEASEEKFKLEIDHQRTTINNLQDVLVATKHDLEEYKQKYDDSVQNQQNLLTRFIQIITDNDVEMKLLKDKFYGVSEKYEKLQELNFSVEVEHCSSLQDVEGMENQLFKYHSLLKTTEDELKNCKDQLKKMVKQKDGFEEVIQYFKTEMATMAQQLQNLQDLLNMSNQSAQEETAKLMQAVLDVKEINQKLTTQLAAAEQKAVLENQMNQLNEAKIEELEKVICEKEVYLKNHVATIQAIRKSMQCSLKENKELQCTISSLKATIAEFQGLVKKYEEDNLKSKENTALCQSEISVCREKLLELNRVLEKKSTELSNLETAYNKQHKHLKTCQTELNKFKDKENTHQLYLNGVIEQLKDQLSKCQDERTRIADDLNSVRTQLNIVKTQESAKEVEIKKYRGLVGELKTTLVELNQILSKKEKSLKRCNHEACQKYKEACNLESIDESTNTLMDEICLNCPCEAEFYASVVEALKKGILELKKRFSGTQKKNEDLWKELHQKEVLVQEISKTQSEKEKAFKELKLKLVNALKQVENEDEKKRKLENEIIFLKQELELKAVQISDLERNSQDICGSKCAQMALAQEEINALKEQLQSLLQQHRAITIESDKLRNQTGLLQTRITDLEETVHLQKGQIKQYLTDLQVFQNEKETLHQKNQDLMYELKSLHTSQNEAINQQRYKEETIKNLEAKLNEAKMTRDEICFESKNTIEYFRHWLQEQNRINKHIVSKERNYCKTIDMLRRQIEETQYPYGERLYRKMPTPRKDASPTCQSPCSLGSQGNESIFGGSPSRSPYQSLGVDSDWISANFRNESSDTELDDAADEDWVSKVEELTEQVKQTNKMWKSTMEKSDFAVTKDSKCKDGKCKK